MIVVTLRYIVWNYTFVPFQQIRVKVNFLVTGAARSIYQLLIVPAAAAMGINLVAGQPRQISYFYHKPWRICIPAICSLNYEISPE